MSTEVEPAENLDFVMLESGDAYATYFNQLRTVFGHLQACYRTEEATYSRAASYEAQVVRGFFFQLLTTVQALRLKYTHRASYDRSLWVDLSESGFPNAAEISQLGVDRKKGETRLQELPSESMLRRKLLDHLFEHGAESEELLNQLSERNYLGMLQPGRLFEGFCGGTFHRLEDADTETARSYVFTWGCYDHKTNRPYIHVMTFEQDENQQPLDREGSTRDEFLAVLKAEGSRAPDVGVLALTIDDALETIHPKIVKRICIGPMYSNTLLKNREPNLDDPREEPIRRYLSKYARRDTDYVLFLSDEVVFSKRQKLTRSLLSPKGKVREIFSIPESDPELFAKRASVIHRYALMPHHVLQHIQADGLEDIPGLDRCKKLTYDEQDNIHGI